MINKSLPSLLEVNLEDQGPGGGTGGQEVQPLSAHVKVVRAVQPSKLLMHLIDGFLPRSALFLILLKLVNKPIFPSWILLVHLDDIRQLVSTATTDYNVVSICCNLLSVRYIFESTA